MFSRCSLDVLKMFAGFFQDVFRMLRWVLWPSSYSMIPAIWWSIGSIDFDNPKVHGDTSITALHWWSCFWSEVRVCRSLVQGLIWSAGLKAEAFRLSIKIWYVRNNYFRSCNPGIGVAFVAVAHWPAGRLPGVSSQRGAGQQRVITRYTSPPLIIITKVIRMQNAIRGWSKEVWLF